MGEFLSYVLPSVPYGCAYSLIAVGLVLTYRSTRVFNFAFAAEAYAAAVIYSELWGHGVQRTLAAALVVFVMAPIFGALLDFGLFSRVPPGNLTAKLVMSLGLMVILPNVVEMIVGPTEVIAGPPPLFDPFHPIFRVAGQAVDGQELCVMLATAVVLIALSLLLRSRRLGLPIRAAVESPKLLELSGIGSARVLRVSWMISTALAALAGVLFASEAGTLVESQNFSILLVAAVAAAALGGLRSLWLAALGGILLGVMDGVMTGYIPPDSIWSSAGVPSLPFFLLLVLLVVHPAFRHLEDVTDPMAAVEPPPPPPALAVRPPVVDRAVRRFRWPFLFAVVAGVVLFVPSEWTSSLTQGAALAIVFLSITLLTGLAGQISLAQALFAGIGACSAAQLNLHEHLPVLLAALAGALVAALGGWAASLPALRLRGLPVALLTLCLALLGDNLIFPTSWIFGTGTLTLNRPSSFLSVSFASVDSEGFFVLVVVVMVVVAALVNLLLRGTTGRALAAVHASPVGAASAGVRTRRLTILVFMLSAGMAGLGGALYGMSLGNVGAQDFNWFFGPTFLVIVVTVGATTVEAAIVAGIAYTTITQAFTFLPTTIGRNDLGGTSLTVVLLSLGAFVYAAHPEGVFEWLRRKVVLALFRAVEHHGETPANGASPPSDEPLPTATEQPA